MEAAIVDFVMDAPSAAGNEAEEATEGRTLVDRVWATIEGALDPELATELTRARVAVVDARAAYGKALGDLHADPPSAPTNGADVPEHARAMVQFEARRAEMEHAVPAYQSVLEAAEREHAALVERARAQTYAAWRSEVQRAREAQLEAMRAAQALLRRASLVVVGVEALNTTIGTLWQIE